MRRYGELCRDQELLLRFEFCPDCIIGTRAYDFREGQVYDKTMRHLRITEPPACSNKSTTFGACRRIPARKARPRLAIIVSKSPRVIEVTAEMMVLLRNELQ
jgi:hypothetical protein